MAGELQYPSPSKTPMKAYASGYAMGDAASTSMYSNQQNAAVFKSTNSLQQALR